MRNPITWLLMYLGRFVMQSVVVDVPSLLITIEIIIGIGCTKTKRYIFSGLHKVLGYCKSYWRYVCNIIAVVSLVKGHFRCTCSIMLVRFTITDLIGSFAY